MNGGQNIFIRNNSRKHPWKVSQFTMICSGSCKSNFGTTFLENWNFTDDIRLGDQNWRIVKLTVYIRNRSLIKPGRNEFLTCDTFYSKLRYLEYGFSKRKKKPIKIDKMIQKDKNNLSAVCSKYSTKKAILNRWLSKERLHEARRIGPALSYV